MEEKVYIVFEEIVLKWKRRVFCVRVFKELKEAKKYFEREKEFLKEKMKSEIESWVTEKNETSYSIYEEGFHSGNHIDIYITCEQVM